MRQKAQVIRRVSSGYVEVKVHRASACASAHNCGSCDGCSLMANAPEIVVQAADDGRAQRGDTVVVESATSSVLSAAAALYIVPILLFFVGYFLGGYAGWSEGTSIALGGCGFAAGLLGAVALDRYRGKVRPVQYRVVSIEG